MILRTPRAALCLPIALVLPCDHAFAQPGSCDPTIKPPSAVSSPYAYRQRTDRCEGIYAREVAGDTLMVASLTRRFDDLTPTSGGHASLSWDSQRGLPVHIAAFSLRPHFYYRMDSVRPAGMGSYDWPTDVLAGLNMTKTDFGVVATVALPGEGGAQDVYLPLRVGTSSAPPKAGEFN